MEGGRKGGEWEGGRSGGTEGGVEEGREEGRVGERRESGREWEGQREGERRTREVKSGFIFHWDGKGLYSYTRSSILQSELEECHGTTCTVKYMYICDPDINIWSPRKILEEKSAALYHMKQLTQAQLQRLQGKV